MQQTRAFLQSLGLPSEDTPAGQESSKRFPDGAQYRVELPSVEGPRALERALALAEQYQIPLHRVSQGSGIMLLDDDEIREMARLGREAGIEVSLFVGPRAAWDTGAQAQFSAGRSIGARLRGIDQVAYAFEDVRRACALGIRSVLIADEGLLWVLDEAKRRGELPADLLIKISVLMGPANPAGALVAERLGAGTLNLATDLSVAQIAAIRRAVTLPLDVYVEVPDDFGGFIRHYDIPDLVRLAAPIYLKFGLRNAPNVYPSGTHLEATAVALTEERVRRAYLGLSLLGRYYPEAVTSDRGAVGLALPVAGSG
jgi:hypothetical protein